DRYEVRIGIMEDVIPPGLEPGSQLRLVEKADDRRAHSVMSLSSPLELPTAGVHGAERGKDIDIVDVRVAGDGAGPRSTSHLRARTPKGCSWIGGPGAGPQCPQPGQGLRPRRLDDGGRVFVAELRRSRCGSAAGTKAAISGACRTPPRLRS